MKPNQLRLSILLLFILIMVASRLWITTNDSVGVLANFTPIGAMALFGGAYFRNGKAFLFPLLALWIGDMLLSRYVYIGEWTFFYDGMLWVYGAFALMVLVGRGLLGQLRTAPRFLGASLLAVLIHWIVTDLGVFLSGTMYPMTWAGWWACLAAAIPFELNFLYGTLLYGAVMFGAFEWFQVRFPILATQRA